MHVVHYYFCSFFYLYYLCISSPCLLQILFATLDPPDPPSQNVPGHFCVVAVNLQYNRFELLDSLRGRNDPDGKRVLHTMATNIKKLWREVSNSKGDSFLPNSIDNWEYRYVRVPRQFNTYVFFYVQMQWTCLYAHSKLLFPFFLFS